MVKKAVVVALSCMFIVGVFLGVGSASEKPAMPALLTSAGQSTDILIVNVMLNKKLDMKIPSVALAKAEDLTGIKTLIVVVGLSNKGLGSAGLDLNAETARVKSLVEYAKQQGITVVLVHTGGAQRRGGGSDQLISLVAPVAEYYVVVKAGNADKLFDKLAAANKAQLVEVETLADAGPAIQKLFQ